METSPTPQRSSFGARLLRASPLILGAPLLALLLLPTLTIALSLPTASWLWTPEASGARTALWLSLKSCIISLTAMIFMGTPLAWWLAQSRARITKLLALIITAPLFLPPSIVGLTLLEATSRDGWLTSLLSGTLSDPSSLAFSYSAVIIAQLTVSAPLYVLGAVVTFRELSQTLIDEARCLGATPAQAWARVSLPLTLPSLAVALSLAGARALGEFGATLLFAGNLPGHTQTAPLAMYLELDRGVQGALALSIGLLSYAIPLLGGLAYLGRRVYER